MKEKKEYQKTVYAPPSREFVLIFPEDSKQREKVEEAYSRMINNRGSDLTTLGMLLLQQITNRHGEPTESFKEFTKRINTNN